MARLKKLTSAAGYDAEATVNWKTGKIVYTSLASGDTDLWTMKPDGSDKKQITTLPKATVEQSCRVTARSWLGAPIIRRLPRLWLAIRNCWRPTSPRR